MIDREKYPNKGNLIVCRKHFKSKTKLLQIYTKTIKTDNEITEGGKFRTNVTKSRKQIRKNKLRCSKN